MGKLKELFGRLRTDWLLHALVSMGICTLCYILLTKCTSEAAAVFFANFIAIGIGFIKETIDRHTEGHSGEWADIVADFAGIALADIVIIVSMVI